MKPKIGIIGDGNVGSALKRGLERAKYEVKSVGHDPKKVQETAAWGEVVILAIPFAAMDDTLREMGKAVEGKTLIDVTNVLTPDYQLALGCTTSGAEQLQEKVPSAKVIKAFNTAFAGHMDTGRMKNEPITLFVAGDEGESKATVLQMGRDIGFDAVDAGPLQNARWLETLGYFHIQLGYMLKMGTDVEFKLIR
ncbi:MAG: NAD(P)-binding domain-containing protein [Candidatus Manganitrophus sp. SA1]|nr:NAD(P)-binding domain-containing protein [Candidatus Manganitrophus morganii]